MQGADYLRSMWQYICPELLKAIANDPEMSVRAEELDALSLVSDCIIGILFFALCLYSGVFICFIGAYYSLRRFCVFLKKKFIDSEVFSKSYLKDFSIQIIFKSSNVRKVSMKRHCLVAIMVLIHCFYIN